MIIGINGKIGSGKDTVGKIIQYLTEVDTTNDSYSFDEFKQDLDIGIDTTWQIKKFAGKLKLIASILTGISVEDLEEEEVKNSCLGNEWCYVETTIPLSCDVNKVIKERNYINAFFDQTDKAFIIYRKLTVREFLQRLGTEAIRNNIHENAWVNALMVDYKGVPYRENWKNDTGLYENKYPNWIVTDMRFPNELKAVKDRSGISIRVKRYDLIYTTPNEHISETALDKAEFDYIINNDGTIEDLIQKVKEILIKEKII